MPKRSKVKLYEQIRRAHDREQLSIHELARRFHVHRRDVRQALASPVPPERKRAERPAPSLDQWKPTIDQWLVALKELTTRIGQSARAFLGHHTFGDARWLLAAVYLDEL